VRRTLDADLAAASEIVSQILLRADLPESAMERRHLRLMVTDLRRNSRWITLSASFPGRSVVYPWPNTMMHALSIKRNDRFSPDVPLRAQLDGCQSFHSCAKPARRFGWTDALPPLVTPQTPWNDA
jgi:transposase